MSAPVTGRLGTCLYICYDSVLEPLAQTQVIAYLEGLARAGHPIVLLTFEGRPLTVRETCTWQQHLAEKGVLWHWTRYHKSPTVPATAFDIAVGVALSCYLVRRYNVSLLHARAHVPGLMASITKRLMRTKFLFDIRGFLAEEYVDGGTWKANGALYRSTKHVEKSLVKHADGIVVLTEAARDTVHRWYPRELSGKPLQVIPCCVDLRPIPRSTVLHQRSLQGQHRLLVYAGKLGGWYPVKEMVEFFAAAKRKFPDLQWQIWTQSDPSDLLRIVSAAGLDDDVAVGKLPPDALLIEMTKAHIALCLYKRGLSASGCSPTKLAEYLAAGLPVVATAGVGDVDAILTNASLGGGEAVGTLVTGYGEADYEASLSVLEQLLDDNQVAERCRSIAEQMFDLERVGWARYRQLYRELMEC